MSIFDKLPEQERKVLFDAITQKGIYIATNQRLEETMKYYVEQVLRLKEQQIENDKEVLRLQGIISQLTGDTLQKSPL